MQIDWLTVVAQVVNFLILVYLLKRFLYGPIIKAMDQREAQVAASLQEAEASRAEADALAQDFYARRDDLERKQEDILEEADRQAEGRRKELIDTARQEAATLQNRWREAIEREKNAFLADLRRRAGDEICAVTTRALRDLADRDLESQVIEIFISRIHSLSVADQQALTQAVRDSGHRIAVRTAFETAPDIRERIEEAVRGGVGSATTVRFERDGNLLCGIELRCEGLKLAWNIAEYMDSLHDGMAEALAEGAAE
jgi:F-type H+-transporting ATPase subunit b